MSTAAAEDVDAFVGARWPELEALALVATLDPTAARALTLAALAAVVDRWEETSGAPTAAARRALLDRVAALPAAPADGSGVAVDPALHAVVADPDDPVPGALLEALAREGPEVRVALADRLLAVDDLGPLDVAGAADPEQPAQARARLILAHRAARESDGLGPDDERLDADLADLLDRLRAAASGTSDPAALVRDHAQQRRARVRRRALVASGGGLLVAGALAAVGVGRAVGGPDRPARPSAAGAPEVWGSTTRWPARGGLAADTGIRARFITSGTPGRVLYADDVEDVRVVVAATVDAPPNGTRFRVLAGSVGAPAEQLVEVPYTVDTISGRPDVLALGVPRPTGALVLVLAGPQVRSAELSAAVRPTAEGQLERTWRVLDLVGGVGALRVGRPWGPAARYRCSGLDGILPLPVAWLDTEDPARGPVEAAVARTAAATVHPASSLRGELAVRGTVTGREVDPRDEARSAATATVSLSLVRTPGRAVVRVLDVRSEDLPGLRRLEVAAVVPRVAARAPVVVRIDDRSTRIGRFLVVVPGGGATIQLLGTSPSGYPLSTVQPLEGEVAVVPVVNADYTGIYRLVVQDARGRSTYDDVPSDAQTVLPDADDAREEAEDLVVPGEPVAAGDPSGSVRPTATAGQPRTGWLGLPVPYGG